VEIRPGRSRTPRISSRAGFLRSRPGFRCPVDAEEPVVDSILSITVVSRPGRGWGVRSGDDRRRALTDEDVRAIGSGEPGAGRSVQRTSTGSPRTGYEATDPSRDGWESKARTPTGAELGSSRRTGGAGFPNSTPDPRTPPPLRFRWNGAHGERGPDEEWSTGKDSLRRFYNRTRRTRSLDWRG
jgi:hypothetical protein